MALYAVERDLRNVQSEQLRLDQRSVARVCFQLKSQGKQIRYISSVVVPADARGFDLFGAATDELVKEAHAAAAVTYSRIVEILDVTPVLVHGSTSRSRRSLQRGAGGSDVGQAKGLNQTMSANSAPDLARWLSEGQRVLGVCLETLENSDRLQSRSQTLENENELLREEIARLRHRVDTLQVERSEMVAAFNDLAGHVTQVVDHILLKSENGEESE